MSNLQPETDDEFEAMTDDDDGLGREELAALAMHDLVQRSKKNPQGLKLTRAEIEYLLDL